MREIRTSGLMSGEGKRGVAEWLKLPRPSSTLLESRQPHVFHRLHGNERQLTSIASCYRARNDDRPDPCFVAAEEGTERAGPSCRRRQESALGRRSRAKSDVGERGGARTRD